MTVRTWIAESSVDHAWRWILATICLCVAFSIGTSELTFRSDYRVFFDQSSKEVRDYSEFESIYGGNDGLIFTVEGATEIFDEADPSAIYAILDLTSDAWKLPAAKRVNSVLNYQDVVAVGDDLTLDHIIRDKSEVRLADLPTIKQTVLKEPLLVNRLVSPSGEVAGIAVEFDLGDHNKDQIIPVIVERARAIAAQTEAKYSDVSIRLSGSVPMDYAFVEASKRDLSVLTPLMFLVIFVLVSLITGSIAAAVLTSIIIGLSIAASMGVAGFLGIPLSPPSIIAPNILLTLATVDCIHVVTRLNTNIRTISDRRHALVKTVEEKAVPIAVTSVATAIGFFSLTLSESPPFRHLGLITGVGSIIAFILSLTLLPALLSKVYKAPRRNTKLIERLSLKICDYSIARPTLVIAGLGTVVIGLSAAASQNALDDRYVDYFDDSFVFKRDATYLQENLTGIYNVEYSASSGIRDGIGEPEYATELEKLATWLRSRDDVYHVDSYTDVIKDINQAMHGGDESYYRIPEHPTGQYLLLYEMSLPYGLDLKNRISMDKSATRLTVSLRDMSTREVKQFLADVDSWQLSNLNQNAITVSQGTGKTVLFAHIGTRNINAMLFGTLVALLLVSLLLAFLLRSPGLGVLATASNLLPALVSLGVWAILVGVVGMAVAVIAAVTLGIVVDATVHIIWSYREALVSGINQLDALRKVFVDVVPAIITSSTVLGAGFFCLYFSGFQITSWMGLMTSVTILVALIIDLLLLPAVLIKTAPKRVMNAGLALRPRL